MPEVKAPTELNDRGGVHGNSSLLNNLAWRLCEKGGMTLEQARAYWFAVDCSMVPGTDYPELANLLPWALKNLGMEEYADSLEAAIDATRLRVEEMPETFDDDRALLTLTLPDTETFTDGNWALGIFSVNLDGLVQRTIDIIDGAPGYESAMDELAHAIDPEGMTSGEDLPALIDELINDYFGETEETEAEEALEAIEATEGSDSVTAQDITGSELFKWLKKYYGEMIFSGMGAAGQDGRTVQMVCRPGLTIPVLLRLEFKPNSMQLQTSGLAVYFGRWIDLGNLVSELVEKMDGELEALDEALDEVDDEASDEIPDELSGLLDMLQNYADGLETEEAEQPEEELEPMTLEEIREMLVNVQKDLKRFAWLKNLFFYEIKPGEVCTLRPDGLEDVTVLDEAHSPDLFGMMEDNE